jgi:nucleoside-diphosphate-sugar epimerase
MTIGTERILVTGASGFIGRALVRRLVCSGASVACTARRRPLEVAEGTSWIVGDLVDEEFVAHVVEQTRPDIVYHLGGASSASRSLDVVLPTLATNLTASVNVLKAVTERGCDRVVLVGSGDEPINGEPPSSPYAAAKHALHAYARMFHALYATPTTTARLFMVYGPDQPDVAKLVPYTILSLLRGERPSFSSGRRLCDWVFIDDVVDALLAVASSSDCVDRVVDVGTGTLHCVRDVVEKLHVLLGSQAEPLFDGTSDRPHETEDVADVVRAHQLCGWSPSTDLATGLERTVAWYTAEFARSTSGREQG